MAQMPKATQIIPSTLARRKYIDSVSVQFIAIITLLVAYGLIVVTSATHGDANYSVARQLLGVAIGVVAMVLIWRHDYRKLSPFMVPLLIVDVVLLLSPHLPIIGVSSHGANSWVGIGGIQFQPGEPAKIVSILLIAAIVARYRGSLDSGRDYLKVCAVCAVPFLCIMTQPDLGTGLVIIVISATILFTGGANRRWLIITLIIVIAGIVAIIALDPYLDQMAGSDVLLKDYQKNRLLVFINTDLDPSGAGYNLNQAKIAIGSGGFLGKGLGNGTQSSMGFLPEAPTDFIFCVVAEELGFVGATVLLVLYFVLLMTSFNIAKHSHDLFGRLVIFGIIGMWTFQILENIGMDCGLMPITGIPLPFMSYGSSFMLTNFMAVGMILSIWRHRAIS